MFGQYKNWGHNVGISRLPLRFFSYYHAVFQFQSLDGYRILSQKPKEMVAWETLTYHPTKERRKTDIWYEQINLIKPTFVKYHFYKSTEYIKFVLQYLWRLIKGPQVPQVPHKMIPYLHMTYSHLLVQYVLNNFQVTQYLRQRKLHINSC